MCKKEKNSKFEDRRSMQKKTSALCRNRKGKKRANEDIIITKSALLNLLSDNESTSIIIAGSKTNLDRAIEIFQIGQVLPNVQPYRNATAVK